MERVLEFQFAQVGAAISRAPAGPQPPQGRAAEVSAVIPFDSFGLGIYLSNNLKEKV